MTLRKKLNWTWLSYYRYIFSETTSEPPTTSLQLNALPQRPTAHTETLLLNTDLYLHLLGTVGRKELCSTTSFLWEEILSFQIAKWNSQCCVPSNPCQRHRFSYTLSSLNSWNTILVLHNDLSKCIITGYHLHVPSPKTCERAHPMQYLARKMNSKYQITFCGNQHQNPRCW